jgi:hypothetical protein
MFSDRKGKTIRGYLMRSKATNVIKMMWGISSSGGCSRINTYGSLSDTGTSGIDWAVSKSGRVSSGSSGIREHNGLVSCLIFSDENSTSTGSCGNSENCLL